MVKETDAKPALEEANPYADILGPPRAPNKKSFWSDEIDRYKSEERLAMSQNPLDWWKLNEYKYPTLGMDCVLCINWILIFSETCENVFSCPSQPGFL